MPLYFFNVFGSESIFDEAGTQLSGPQEARRRMIFIAIEVIQRFKVDVGDRWQMEALDATGKIVGSMDFSVED